MRTPGDRYRSAPLLRANAQLPHIGNFGGSAYPIGLGFMG
jgi:hypothetical protein